MEVTHLNKKHKASHYETANFKRINGMIHAQLQDRIQDDPAADLSDFLRWQADIYPKLRGVIAGEESPQSSITVGVAEDHDEGDNASTFQDFPDSLLIKSDHIRIKDKFDKDFPVVMNRTSKSKMDPSMLNEKMKQGTLLWELDGLYIFKHDKFMMKTTLASECDEVCNMAVVTWGIPNFPLPRPLGSLVAGNRFYFFMSRDGDMTLESVWSELTKEHKLSVQAQLNGHFLAFREQRVYGRKNIGGLADGVCKDNPQKQRIGEDRYLDETGFNDFLCDFPTQKESPSVCAIRSAMRDDHRIVRTYGNLHPRNIMVEWMVEEGMGKKQEIRVTSLINWEMAGYYPEHWEYCRALRTIPQNGPLSDWRDYLPAAIGQWPAELALDQVLGQVLDQELDRWTF